VGTFASITLYAMFVLVGMIVAAGAFTLLGVLVSDSTVEEDGEH
jgi:hypothetical protein